MASGPRRRDVFQNSKRLDFCSKDFLDVSGFLWKKYWNMLGTPGRQPHIEKGGSCVTQT